MTSSLVFGLHLYQIFKKINVRCFQNIPLRFAISIWLLSTYYKNCWVIVVLLRLPNRLLLYELLTTKLPW